MAVTPYVYSFNPGAATTAGYMNGVARVFQSTLGPHHWIVIGTPSSTSITLQNKLNALLYVRFSVVSSTIVGFLSLDGGVTYTAGSRWSGNTAFTWASAPNSADFGVVVELEDAITFASRNGAAATGQLLPYSLGFGIHIGKIFSPHNRNDAGNSVGEYGVLAGVLAVSTGTALATNAMLHTTGFNSTNGYLGTQGLIRTGESTWGYPCAPADANRNKATAAQEPMLANIGDAGDVERLAPIPVSLWTTNTSTGVQGAHIAFTRYLRARNVSYGGSISNETVVPSATDPNIAWRHNACGAAIQNLVHIWSQSLPIAVP